MFRQLLVIVCLLIVISSCVKDCPVTCTETFEFYVVGYDTSELQTVVFNSYKGDHNFDQLIRSDTTHFSRLSQRDTIFLNPSSESNYVSLFTRDKNDSLMDWEVIIPGKKTYQISNLQYTGARTGSETPRGSTEVDCHYANTHPNCNRTLVSYKLNGIFITTVSPNWLTIYLPK